MGIVEKTRGNIVGGIVAYLGGQKLTWGSSYPTEGTWKQGDLCFNTGATGSATTGAGWICTTGNSSGGVWKKFGDIAASA